MKWVVLVLIILAAVGAAASTSAKGSSVPPSPSLTSLDLRCGFGPYDNDVRGVVRVSPPSTDPHC